MLEREPGELTRGRVPCEQPLHMGESVLSRRRTPGLATTAENLIDAARTTGERGSRSDSGTRSRVALPASSERRGEARPRALRPKGRAPRGDETRGSRPSLERQSYLFWLTPHRSHESLRAEAGTRARRENARAPWILRGLSGGGRTVKTRANGARLSRAGAYRTPHQVSKVNSLWV